jgi:hypothetical protein
MDALDLGRTLTEVCTCWNIVLCCPSDACRLALKNNCVGRRKESRNNWFLRKQREIRPGRSDKLTGSKSVVVYQGTQQFYIKLVLPLIIP